MTDLGDPPAFAATCAGIDNLDAEVDHEIDIAALESMPRLERVAEVRERRAKYREAMFAFERGDGPMPGDPKMHARYAAAFRKHRTVRLTAAALGVTDSAASVWFQSFGAAHGVTKIDGRTLRGKR